MALADRQQHDPAFWRSRQVAEWLSVTPRTVCLWAELGEIPALRVGRQWRFRASDLKLWLERKHDPLRASLQHSKTVENHQLVAIDKRLNPSKL